MAKYLIKWDFGCGEMQEVIAAETQEEADVEAYQEWLEGAHSQADYSAELATSENLDEAGFDPEEFGFAAIEREE